MAMTLDQARFHLQSRVHEWRERAEQLRRQIDEVERRTRDEDDKHLRRVGHESAGRLKAEAWAIEQDVEALTLLLAQYGSEEAADV